MSIALMSTFDEYYDQLVHRQWTLQERLNAVKRDEVGERERIAEDEQAAFADVLHVAGVMIGEKKKRESKADKQGDQPGSRALALRGEPQLLTVWVPELQPRTLPRPVGRPQLAFPHAAYNALCGEERELRSWLHSVEQRLREHVEQACSRSWFVLTCLQTLVEQEQRARARLLRDEYETFAQMRRRVFLLAPADYFRKEAVRRFGGSSKNSGAAGEQLGEGEHSVAGVVAREAELRAAIEASERASHAQVCAYVDEIYKTRQFMINHQEIVGRLAIEDAARDALYPLIERHCRASLGLPYHRTAAVVLHSGGAYPAVLMQQLCMQHSAHMRTRASAFLQSYTQQQQQQRDGSSNSSEAAVPWELAMRDKLGAEEMSRLLLRYCDDKNKPKRGSESSKRSSVSSLLTPAAALRLQPSKSAQQQQQEQQSQQAQSHSSSAKAGGKPASLLTAVNGCNGKVSAPASCLSGSPCDTGLTPTPVTKQQRGCAAAAANGNGNGPSSSASSSSPARPTTPSVLSEQAAHAEGATLVKTLTHAGRYSGNGVLRHDSTPSNSLGGSPATTALGAPGTSPTTTSGRRSSPRVTITTKPVSSAPHRSSSGSFHAFVSDDEGDTMP